MESFFAVTPKRKKRTHTHTHIIQYWSVKTLSISSSDHSCCCCCWSGKIQYWWDFIYWSASCALQNCTAAASAFVSYQSSYITCFTTLVVNYNRISTSCLFACLLTCLLAYLLTVSVLVLQLLLVLLIFTRIHQLLRLIISILFTTD